MYENHAYLVPSVWCALLLLPKILACCSYSVITSSHRYILNSTQSFHTLSLRVQQKTYRVKLKHLWGEAVSPPHSTSIVYNGGGEAEHFPL